MLTITITCWHGNLTVVSGMERSGFPENTILGKIALLIPEGIGVLEWEYFKQGQPQGIAPTNHCFVLRAVAS